MVQPGDGKAPGTPPWGQVGGGFELDKGKCPCPWQGWNQMSFEGPSDPTQSGIL